MSMKFGPIRQLGYVVRDIESAMLHWATALGIGPWFYNEHFEFNSFSYAGARHDGLDISVAMANSGGHADRVGPAALRYAQHVPGFPANQRRGPAAHGILAR